MNEREDQLVELLALDGDEGPARRIAAAEAEAIVAAALAGVEASVSLDAHARGESDAIDAAARARVESDAIDGMARARPEEDAVGAARARVEAIDPARARGMRLARPRLWLIAAAGIAVAVFSGGAVAAWYTSRVVAERERSARSSESRLPVIEETPPQVVSPEVEDETREVVEVPRRRDRERDRDRKKLDAPEDLLARANELRGREKWAEAERTYARVVRNHPRSQAAYVAAIASASLRLEHLGNPRGALEMFERARTTQPNGALDADVLFGMAAAHRALGDRALERSTLERLLARHPRSVFAPAAKKRLAEAR